MKKLYYGMVALVLVVLLAQSVFFTVDETEYAIVVHLGRPVRVITTPGLAVKLPAPVQTVISLDKRLLVFDPPGAEFLTLDKKNIIADSYLCWRISDPLRFLQTVGTRKGAEARLSDLVSSEIGVSLGTRPFSSLVSVNPEEVTIVPMMEKVRRHCDEIAGREYGISVVDVRLKRINFPEQNKQSVFDRMMAERRRIAKKYRAEGEQEALKITGETEKREKEIMAEAYMRAQKLKGEGEAQAARIYTEAHQKNPEFYRFIRKLEAYRKFMNERTTVVLDGDSELLELFMQGEALSGEGAGE